AAAHHGAGAEAAGQARGGDAEDGEAQRGDRGQQSGHAAAHAERDADLFEQRAEAGDGGAQVQRGQDDGHDQQVRGPPAPARGAAAGRVPAGMSPVVVDANVRVSSPAMGSIIESWDDSLSNALRRPGAPGVRRCAMPLSHPRRAALSEQVIAALRAQITTGEWPVGSRIPTEPELVEQLGVARNTVREAVRALAHNGLLDIRQGSGTYVVATSELAGVMQRRFAGADPRHVAELRSTLESAAARLASERRTEKDLKQLDALLLRREEAWESGEAEAFVTADATFHLAVVAASHNDVMTAMYADLGEVLRDWLRDDVGASLSPETHMEHGRLVDAIRAGDATAAAEVAAAYPLVCRPGRVSAPPSGG